MDMNSWIVPAKYAGTCPFCNQPFAAGTEIRRAKKKSMGWGHVKCPPIPKKPVVRINTPLDANPNGPPKKFRTKNRDIFGPNDNS